MKYYSDTLNKFFDSEEECLKKEQEYEIALNEKRLKEKELKKTKEARKAEVIEAYEKYADLLKSYLKDYKSLEIPTDNMVIDLDNDSDRPKATLLDAFNSLLPGFIF